MGKEGKGGKWKATLGCKERDPEPHPIPSIQDRFGAFMMPVCVDESWLL